MKTRLRHIRNGTTGEDLGWVLQFWCPGCSDYRGHGGMHQVGIAYNGGKAYGEQWEWDGNLEAPTISPSLLVTSPPTPLVCHSFIKNGQWQYLQDSTHALAGQTVDMVDLPDWLAQE